MSVAHFDGLFITIEAALSSATSTYGVWDAALWDATTWGPDEVYVDISRWFRSLNTQRRFGREVFSWENGGGTLVLDDQDGRFSPHNLSGPYVAGGVTAIRPWRKIRVQATYGGVTYPVVLMYALDWVDSYPETAGPNAGTAITTVPLADEWARLSGYNGLAVAPVGASDLFGPRIHRILNAAGNTAPRAIEVGVNTMQATTLAGDTGNQLRLTADSEGGSVYIGPSGEIIAEGQFALNTNTRSIVSQATFGDGPGEIPYAGVQLSGGGDLITNVISYQRVGGVAQTVVDNTSRALYGDRTDPRSDLICTTDLQALQLASFRLARFKAPEQRVTALEVHPRLNPAALYPLALGLKVHDLVTIVRRPPGGYTITQFCHISGITHMVTQDNWVTVFEFSSASPYRAFAASLWSVGTWGASVSDTTAALWFF